MILPPNARLGRGILLSYQGLGTAIHKRDVIGDGATMVSGMTGGGRTGHQAGPLIGEGAMIWIGARFLGSARVGRFAAVGAHAVVLDDMPDFAVAVGIPAKMIKINRPEDIPDYRSLHGAE